MAEKIPPAHRLLMYQQGLNLMRKDTADLRDDAKSSDVREKLSDATRALMKATDVVLEASRWLSAEERRRGPA